MADAGQIDNLNEQVRSLQRENTLLKEKGFRMEDQLQQVFKTLGKVTGDNQSPTASQSDNLKSSSVGHNSDESEKGKGLDMLALSRSGCDDRL